MTYKLTLIRLLLLENQLNERLQNIAKRYNQRHPNLEIKIPIIKIKIRKLQKEVGK